MCAIYIAGHYRFAIFLLPSRQQLRQLSCMRFNDDDLPAEEDEGDAPARDLRRLILWRYILSSNPRPDTKRELVAEILAEAPHLATTCQAWIESEADKAGISLADQLDVEAGRAGHPLLREFADTVLALTISGLEIHRLHQRRLTGSLVNSWKLGGPKTADPRAIARAITITVGAMSIAHWVRLSVFNREFITSCEVTGSFITDELAKAEREDLLNDLRKNGGLVNHAAELWIDDTPSKPATGVLIGQGELDSERDRPYLKALRKVMGVPVPVVESPDLASVQATLLAERPWATEAIGLIVADLAGRTSARLSPILLVGPSGAGKSELVRRLGELLGVGVWIASATTEASSAIAGTSRRYSSAEPCHPLQAIARFGHANPIFLVDDLDKAASGTLNGRLWDALLPFMDSASAACFMDPAAMIEVDLSHVTYLATANSTAAIPQVLLDRFRVFEIPAPGREHLPAILSTMLKRAARSRGLREEWMEPFDEAETAVIRARWTNGSLRSLQRLVAGILRSREKLAPRH